jgi:DNA topoisomerase-2
MPYTRMIYDERDEAILERRQEEGHPIEWATYVPIIPMILVNGCNGIATGYRSQIPCHDPCALIDNLLRKMSGGEFRPFDPWYGTGWTGTVLSGTDWAYRGVYEQRGNRVVVTDLPIGVATEKYKSGILSRLLESKHVLSVVEAHPSENLVRFELVVAQSFDASMLKLESKMSKQCLNLMVNGRITHFASTLSILERYYVWRLALYGRRKESMLSVWDARLLELTFKQRFILGVLSGRIVLKRAKKADVVASAIALGIPAALCDKFCALSLLSLTRERVAELEAEVGRIREDIAALAGTSPTALWETDLRALKPVVRKWLASAERVPKRPKAGGKGERSNNKKKMRTV